MILCVAGSRKYPAPQEVIEFLYGFAAQFPGSVIVSGGNGIVAQTAEPYCKTVGLDLIVLKPTEVNPQHYQMTAWAYGDLAEKIVTEHKLRETTAKFDNFTGVAHFRSQYMVGISERLVAFWDGSSPGTRNEMDLAHVKGIPASCKKPGLPMQPV